MSKQKYPAILSLDLGGLSNHEHLSLSTALAFTLKYRVANISHIQMLYLNYNGRTHSSDTVYMEVGKYYILLTAYKNHHNQTLAIFPKKPLSSRGLSKIIHEKLKESLGKNITLRKVAYGMCADLGLAKNFSDAFLAPVHISHKACKIYRILLKCYATGTTFKTNNPKGMVAGFKAGAWNDQGWQELIDIGLVEVNPRGPYLIHRAEYKLVAQKGADTKEKRRKPMSQQIGTAIILTAAVHRSYMFLLETDLNEGVASSQSLSPQKTLRENQMSPQHVNILIAKGLLEKTSKRIGHGKLYLLHRKEVKIQTKANRPPKTTEKTIPTTLSPEDIPVSVSLKKSTAALYAMLLDMAPDNNDANHFYLPNHSDLLNAVEGKSKNWYSIILRELKGLHLVSGTRAGIHIYKAKYSIKANKPRGKTHKPGNGKIAAAPSIRNLTRQLVNKINTVVDLADFLVLLGKELKKQKKALSANDEKKPSTEINHQQH